MSHMQTMAHNDALYESDHPIPARSSADLAVSNPYTRQDQDPQTYALREAHVAKQKRGVLVVPDPSIPREAWGEAGGLLEATPPANPADPWTAKLKQRGDGARDLARKRRRALRSARADVGTLSSYESYFKTAQSENDLVRERALTLVLDATPRGRVRGQATPRLGRGRPRGGR